MNILQTIRDWTGFQGLSKIIIEDEQGNVVDVDQLADRKRQSLEDIITKGQDTIDEIVSQYDEDDQTLELKLQACDVYLNKAQSEDVQFNKLVLNERREKLFNDFILNVTQTRSELSKAIDELDQLQKGGRGSGRHKSGLSNNQAEAYKTKFGLTDDELVWRENHNAKIRNAKGEEFNRLKKEYDDSEVAKKIRSKMVEKGEDDDLEKGGEGSRGGLVIGHTKSGKPIYKHFDHPSHESFTNEDHEDAVKVHERNTLSRRVGNRDKALHKKAAQGLKFDNEKQEWVKRSEITDLSKAEDYKDNYVAIVAKDSKGRVLLMKRKDGKGWMLPGGHIESGEHPIEAAKREFKEETNLDVRTDDLISYGDKELEGGKCIYYYGTSSQSGLLANIDEEDEATDVRYMSADEWMGTELFKDTKEHLKSVLLPQVVVKGEEDDLEKGGVGSGRKKGSLKHYLKWGGESSHHISNRDYYLHNYDVSDKEKVKIRDHVRHAQAQSNFKISTNPDGTAPRYPGIDKAEETGELSEYEIELQKAIDLIEQAHSEGFVEAEKYLDVIEKAKKVIVHSTEALVKHARNTSDTQLRKVMKSKDHPTHLRDAARVELGNRTKNDRSEKWTDILGQIKNKAKKEKLNVADLVSQLETDLQDNDETRKNNDVLVKTDK